MLRADLQVVDGNATAMDILSLVLKQLAGLGVPGPHDIARLQRPEKLFEGFGSWCYVDQSINQW